MGAPANQAPAGEAAAIVLRPLATGLVLPRREMTRHHFCFSRISAESNLEPYNNTSEPWTFSGDTPEIDEEIQRALEEFKPLPEGMPGLFYRYYQAMNRGAELPITLKDARQSIELITAIYYSARNGQAVVRPMMGLSLSFDHRAIDGAPAAAFLARLREVLEQPYLLLL